ncbi:hypothetical protein DMC30DRAFT_278838 [Rhodotorula diobovata]|uniref:Secreted protein n=1 Tax=Rhodotorula diobovata TaxID=5288 RepID=A0A5C5G5H9_9BASI|nr:hypothetical protein DMC30DRAFT_278838 [Rhodotorula diobovata]
MSNATKACAHCSLTIAVSLLVVSLSLGCGSRSLRLTHWYGRRGVHRGRSSPKTADTLVWKTRSASRQVKPKEETIPKPRSRRPRGCCPRLEDTAACKESGEDICRGKRAQSVTLLPSSRWDSCSWLARDTASRAGFVEWDQKTKVSSSARG